MRLNALALSRLDRDRDEHRLSAATQRLDSTMIIEPRTK
jgi:hypothetical protein